MVIAVGRLLLLLLLSALVFPASSLSTLGQRFALVIGNGAYQVGALKNPANDATDMAAALELLGFQVILKTDTDQRAMEDAIRSFGKNLRQGGVGLFYYAGHGVQLEGRNYLIPVDARIETESEVKYEAVDVGRVLGQMEDAGNGLNIIILDACRDNPFARSFRSSSSGLTRMDTPEGSILAYATAPGKVALDGDGRNGLYTAKILKYLETPGLPIEQFFKHVRRDVREASDKKQIPWTESSLIGDFSFNPSKIVARDGKFEQLVNGIVRDTKTSLEWYSGPDRDVSWNEALRWATSLDIDGGKWRLPTIRELKSLSRKEVGPRRITRLLVTTGLWVWSSETGDLSSARTFSILRSSGFFLGSGGEGWLERGYSVNGRVFAVRYRSDAP